MTDILEVRDLVVSRDGHQVLQVDQLRVREGETLVIIGPNGSGKTTLLLSLARLLRADGGQVGFRGALIEPEDELAYRRRLGLVLQTALLLRGSVERNVSTGLRFRGIQRAEIKSRAAKWLTRVGIGDLAHRSARSLSGGEQQRVSLARALASEPDLLLLDEPFASLDPPTRVSLMRDLRELLDSLEVTTLFVTHDLDEALLLGDRVAVLLGGELRQIGSPEQVFSAPADREIAAFVGIETVIAGQVSGVDEGRVMVNAGGVRLEAIGVGEIGQNVYLCLRPEDVTLHVNHVRSRSSARNRLRVRISQVIAQGTLIRVVVDCGFPLVALITRASAREMGLEPGTEVGASFKATAIHLIPH